MAKQTLYPYKIRIGLRQPQADAVRMVAEEEGIGITQVIRDLIQEALQARGVRYRPIKVGEDQMVFQPFLKDSPDAKEGDTA